jgi:Ser/Thr protein kinase RdoA (MazF antagonist)
MYASGVTIPVDHPSPYHVVIDRPSLDYVVVMEDLDQRGADPRDATRPMTVDQVANGVRALARLHREYWGFTAATHPQLAWVQTWEPTEGFQVGLRRRVPTGLVRAGAALPAAVARYDADEIVDLWVRFVRTLRDAPMTLLHGDPHIGNTYVLPDDDVGFLDWEVVRRGNWSHDLGYFVVGSLTIDDRRRCQHDVVDAYLAALDMAAGERPSREEAWRRFRASAAYGLAIWLSTLGTDGWQRHEVSLALAQRYATAFVDLDTLGALDALGV